MYKCDEKAYLYIEESSITSWAGADPGFSFRGRGAPAAPPSKSATDELYI